MAAIHMAVLAALADRKRSVLAAHELYGATVGLLMNVLEPSGVAVRFADACDLNAFRAAVAEARPGCVVVETISNPLLRVAPLDKLAEIAREAGAALIVDNTFATPVIARPMELGAHMVVHSATKYLAGHGDTLGGVVVTDAAHYDTLRALSRTIGPVLGPFESYLTMRGIKTLPLRMERHCANACRVAQWLEAHPRVERVYFPASAAPGFFAPGMYGAMVSFEIRGAGREEAHHRVPVIRRPIPEPELERRVAAHRGTLLPQRRGRAVPRLPDGRVETPDAAEPRRMRDLGEGERRAIDQLFREMEPPRLDDAER
jgi:cystathionine gamma-synthase/methionine-gamma-lyase